MAGAGASAGVLVRVQKNVPQFQHTLYPTLNPTLRCSGEVTAASSGLSGMGAAVVVGAGVGAVGTVGTVVGDTTGAVVGATGAVVGAAGAMVDAAAVVGAGVGATGAVVAATVVGAGVGGAVVVGAGVGSGFFVCARAGGTRELEMRGNTGLVDDRILSGTRGRSGGGRASMDAAVVVSVEL